MLFKGINVHLRTHQTASSPREIRMLNSLRYLCAHGKAQEVEAHTYEESEDGFVCPQRVGELIR